MKFKKISVHFSSGLFSESTTLLLLLLLLLSRSTIDHGDEDNLVDGGAAREKELNNSESVQGSSELQWFLHTNIHSIFPYI